VNPRAGLDDLTLLTLPEIEPVFLGHPDLSLFIVLRELAHPAETLLYPCSGHTIRAGLLTTDKLYQYVYFPNHGTT
jgi:hypothetical protein